MTVFVRAQTRVEVPFRQAAARLDEAVADGGLVSVSQQAADDGLTYLARVRPAGLGRFGKEVRVRLLPAHWVGGHVVVALRWEPTGATAGLFPSLDADLTLYPDEVGSVVGIVGCYRPPLGALGARVDRVLLSRAAQATVQALTEEVARRLTELCLQASPRDTAPLAPVRPGR
jgi:hypothetical protein